MVMSWCHQKNAEVGSWSNTGCLVEVKACWRHRPERTFYSGKGIYLCRTNPWDLYRYFLCVWMCVRTCDNEVNTSLRKCRCGLLLLWCVNEVCIFNLYINRDLKPSVFEYPFDLFVLSLSGNPTELRQKCKKMSTCCWFDRQVFDVSCMSTQPGSRK